MDTLLMSLPSDVTKSTWSNDVKSTMSLPGLSSQSTGNDVRITTLMTQKPYEGFTEVKVAIIIERIYVPLVVSVGLVGNMLCFVTLVFTKLRSTTTCVYMAVIAVIDSTILVCKMCALVTSYLGHTKFYMRSDWTCRVLFFLFYFSIHFDVLLLIAMTIDRFIVVKFPLKGQRLCKPCNAMKAVLVVGLFSLALNFRFFFITRLGESGNPEDPLKCQYVDPEEKLFMKKIYTWMDASIYSFIPFLSLLVLNTLIIRQIEISSDFSKYYKKGLCGGNMTKGYCTNVEAERGSGTSSLKTSSSDLSSGNGMSLSSGSCKTQDESPGGVSSNKVVQTDSIATTGGKRIDGCKGKSITNNGRKATDNTYITVMLLVVTFTFLLMTSPVVILNLYERYYWLPSTNAEKAKALLFYAVTENLMYTNHAVNFLLYCIPGRRFRQEFKRLVERIGFHRRSIRSNPSTLT